jgi:regulator of ribosome biosynthesis
MDSLVQDILLKSSAEKEAKYKTTEVIKDIDVDIDEGHLLAIDPNPLNLKDLR